MELGNMIFGNSRGDFEVPRTDEFEEPWERFTNALKINWRGYADNGCLVPELTKWNGVGNSVFEIRAYDWDAECDCGAEETMDEWHEGHKHAATCYQAELRARMKSWEDRSGYTDADRAIHSQSVSPMMAGMDVETENPFPGITTMVFAPRTDGAMETWRKLYDRRRKVENKLYIELCTKHGLSRQGCAVHCTCSHDAEAEAYWRLIGGHTASCRFTQPNFLFRPTGFRMNWYKYPFRDSYMSEEITGAQWVEILDACATSVSADTPLGRHDDTQPEQGKDDGSE